MQIDYKILELALNSAIEKYVQKIVIIEGKSNIYAIGFYINGEFSYIIPTCSISSDGRNTGTGSDTMSEKWSPPEWKYHDSFPETFEEVEQIMLKGWDSDYSSFYINSSLVYSIMIKILKRLKENMFKKSDTILGIFMGAMGSKIVDGSIEEVNSIELYRKYRLEYIESLS